MRRRRKVVKGDAATEPHRTSRKKMKAGEIML